MGRTGINVFSWERQLEPATTGATQNVLGTETRRRGRRTEGEHHRWKTKEKDALIRRILLCPRYMVAPILIWATRLQRRVFSGTIFAPSWNISTLRRSSRNSGQSALELLRVSSLSRRCWIRTRRTIMLWTQKHILYIIMLWTQ